MLFAVCCLLCCVAVVVVVVVVAVVVVVEEGKAANRGDREYVINGGIRREYAITEW